MKNLCDFTWLSGNAGFFFVLAFQSKSGPGSEMGLRMAVQNSLYSLKMWMQRLQVTPEYMLKLC